MNMNDDDLDDGSLLHFAILLDVPKKVNEKLFQSLQKTKVSWDF